jgi:CO/xanthine dehydrogenase Mo-binding subunit
VATSPSLKGSPNVDDWLSFDEDGRITVRSGKVDIGQRVSAAVALVAAEELDVDPARIRVAERVTGAVPNEGYTSGSRSMEMSATAVRLAAATARRRLLTMAAAQLGAEADALEISDGLIRVPDTNRAVSYWDLTGGKATGIAVDPDVAVKAPDAYRVLGRPHEAPILKGLVTGAGRFVHDMSLPGMLHARVVRPPHYHARLVSLADDIEGQLSGGRLVRDGSFLAVVHEDEWTAIKLAERVAAAATWAPEQGLDARDIFERLVGNDRVSLPVVDGTPVDAPVPDLADPPSAAVATLHARFERPYQMHASMAPSAAMAHLDGDLLTLWSHSQGPYQLRASVAEALERDPETVRVIHAPGAGCYGHNGADDAAFDGALVACAIPGTPIMMKYTRADEHGWEPYGSAMVADLRGSVDADGRIVAWSHENFSDTHVTRPQPGPGGRGGPRLISARLRENPLTPPPAVPAMGTHMGIHRNQDPLYDLPAGKRIVKHLVRDLPLRTSSLRGLGALVNVLAIESFMDELAEAASVDAVDFRLRHLSDPRGRAVIESTAEKMNGWDKVDGRGCGLAFARYKNDMAYAAIAVEVSVDDAAVVHLHRAAIAADAGDIIDPQGIVSQLEGGMLQAASLTLHEKVRYDTHGITSRDWESYPILGFDNVPEIETILIERPGDPFLGVGEAATGPTAGAIANAIYNAVGLRLRRLPFDVEAIRAAAMA